ncbi:MAG TPA: beta-eliminating lyase-related protein, partial [Acidimicrobiia bacterium]|nr:beta-eliminating lyase-related protein [Acidimicrobiia bacterium]
GGTPANILAIEPLLDKYGALLCSDEAHVWRDEAGAPERNLGNKLYSVETVAGKITPEAIKTTLTQFEDAHQPLPQAITITQPTELGTVYRLEELQAVSAVAKANNLKLHIDGARICNAAAFLKCSLGDIVNASGASSLSLGMTKNGGMFGENIVFFKPDLAENFLFRRRNLMQVQSKMRFISAQFNAFFENDL